MSEKRRAALARFIQIYTNLEGVSNPLAKRTKDGAQSEATCNKVASGVELCYRTIECW